MGSKLPAMQNNNLSYLAHPKALKIAYQAISIVIGESEAASRRIGKEAL